jgi:hypothetical protein
MPELEAETGTRRGTADERIGSFTLTVASYLVLIKKKKVKTDGPTRNLFCFSCFHSLFTPYFGIQIELISVTIYTV